MIAGKFLPSLIRLLKQASALTPVAHKIIAEIHVENPEIINSPKSYVCHDLKVQFNVFPMNNLKRLRERRSL